MNHLEKPELAAVLPDFKDRLEKLMASDYYAYVRPLADQVKGKVVARSLVGTSGFVLFFEDQSWVAVHLQDDQLCWSAGVGAMSEGIEDRINSPDYGSGSDPLSVNLPYADERCDLKSEIANANGHQITGLAYGERCFNFCFPDSMELDIMLVPTTEGSVALRVFWEQW